MRNQIDKAITKCQAKLDSHKQNNKDAEGHMRKLEVVTWAKCKPVFLCQTQKVLEKRMLKEVAAALGIHREKLSVAPMSVLWLVTKLITRNDPEWQPKE